MMSPSGPIAFVELPSFTGFPGIGLVALTACLVTVAGSLRAASLIAGTPAGRQVPRGGAWATWFELLALAVLAGVLVVGPLAIPIGLLALVVTAVVVLRGHDGRARAEDRLLSGHGLRLALASLGGPRKRKVGGQGKGQGKAGPAAAGPSTVREWMQSFAGRDGKLRADPRFNVPPPPREPALALLKKDGTPVVAATVNEEGLSDNVRRVREMLVAAMKLEATDIHFEPHEQEYVIRYRIDGVLQDGDRVEALAGRGVLSALKVVADMNIAERRRPQDGTFSALLDEAKYDIRVASTPTSYGEKMVLRLLQSSGGMLTSGLDSIGLRSAVLKQLREIIHKPYGMFLVAGPTGSGKTTTVYAALSEIDAHQHNITTIEDPVEYRLDGITQIAVNSKADVSFASILRSVLRQDPDVLLVGEIRDKETAEIACQAALTGHFVFSTLHANDTVATITRLLELGLDPSLIQTAVTAVLGQRLTRRLCPECREPVEPPAGLEKRFNLREKNITHVYRERGCEHCRGTGYKGRLGIHELMVMSDPIRELIVAQPSINDLRAATLRGGTQTLQTDGLLKVCKGVTSVNEILRVTT
jgi:type II secretory ATPase GspE/PulE/Tfp pilus assembly ATPase PilB-like protein